MCQVILFVLQRKVNYRTSRDSNVNWLSLQIVAFQEKDAHLDARHLVKITPPSGRLTIHGPESWKILRSTYDCGGIRATSRAAVTREAAIAVKQSPPPPMTTTEKCFDFGQTLSSPLFSSTSRPLSTPPQLVSQAATVCVSAQDRFTRSSNTAGTFLVPSTSARAPVSGTDIGEPWKLLCGGREGKDSENGGRGRV